MKLVQKCRYSYNDRGEWMSFMKWSGDEYTLYLKILTGMIFIVLDWKKEWNLIVK